MSEPATAYASLSATGYEDGLGRRTLEFDREGGAMLERLRLRAEFGAFETALRQRMDRLAPFDDARFARVRAVERDTGGTVAIVSSYVAGDRLCDLLEAATNLPAHEATSPSVDAALGFLLEVLPALDAFHSATGLTHGAVEPGRIALTPSGEVVLLDTLLGQVLERLQFNRRRLWTEFGLAMAPAAGPSRFDRAADVAQTSLAAMMIVLGRPFRADDYPDALLGLMNEVIEIAQIRGSGRFASGLHKYLHRTLPLPARRPHASAEEAAAEVRQIAREIGVQRCRAALTAFVGDMNRVITDAREHHAPEHGSVIEIPFGGTRSGGLAAVEEPEPVEIASEPESSSFDVIADPDPIVVEPLPDPVPEPLAELGYEPAPAEEIENAPDFVEEPAPAFAKHLAVEPIVMAEEAPVVVAEQPAPAPVVVQDVVPVVEKSAPAPAPVVIELPALEPMVVAAAPPPAAVVEPLQAPAAATEPPQPAETAKQPEPEPAPVESKRKRLNARRYRDKLRSHAAPPPPVRPPAPPMPRYEMPLPNLPAPAPPPRKIAQPLRDETPIAPPMPVAPPMPIAQPIPIAPPVPIAPIASIRVEPPAALQPSAPLRLKTEPPPGFARPPARIERPEPLDMTAVPYVDRGGPPEEKRSFPWRLVAAAVLVVGLGIGAGRKFLPNSSAAEAAAPVPSSEVVAAAKAAEASAKSGTIVMTTEPAGAHVLLDGKEMGDSPLTLENVPAGKHSLTFVTASASVKRIVRVESGKTISIDVAVFSGWIAVFSPIPLDIAENGRAIGSSEQGRLMLSPGRHQLTLTNTELGYSTVQMVDIEPGEERPVSVQPSGELSANAVPWAEVWMNGKKIGETPVARLVVPLGTHEVVFKNPQFPERHVTVTVTAAAPVTASVDFSK